MALPLPPPPRTGPPAPLAATIGTLATGTPVRIWELPPGLSIRWLLEVDPDQSHPHVLEHIYRHLDHPIRPHLWEAFGTPDPHTDPAGYHAARWWHPTDRVGVELILRMETAGLLHPWAPNSQMVATTV